MYQKTVDFIARMMLTVIDNLSTLLITIAAAALIMLTIRFLFGQAGLRAVATKVVAFGIYGLLAFLLVVAMIAAGPGKGILLLLALGAAVGAFVWFAYESAAPKRDANGKKLKDQPGLWTTLVPEQEFKFVMKGESLHKVLPNLRGAGLDIHDKVTTVQNEIQPVYTNPLLEWLRAHIGIYWVSILYPLRSVYTYKIDKFRLVDESKLPPGHQMKDMVEVERDVEVSSLRRIIPRPLYFDEVELGDNFAVNMVVMTEFAVINPRIPIFDLKGKFFPLLDAAIEGAVNDQVNKYAGYVALLGEKTGRVSPFSDAILALVADKLEQTVGIRPTACYIVRVDLPQHAQAERDASRAKELEVLKGQGVIAKADAQAKALERLADADAKTFAAQVEALTKLKVDPNIAAHQVARSMGLRAISNPESSITTFVEANSGAPVGVTVTTPTTPAPASAPTP